MIIAALIFFTLIAYYENANGMGNFLLAVTFCLVLAGFPRRFKVRDALENSNENNKKNTSNLSSENFLYEGNEKLVSLKNQEPYDVVGESFYKKSLNLIAEYLDNLPTPTRYVVAELKREPKNKQDSNAIAVYIGSYQVGYLSREDAKNLNDKFILWEKLDKKVTCKAMIKGKDLYGVILFMPTKFPKPPID